MKDTLNQKANEAKDLIAQVTTNIQVNYTEPVVNRVADGLTAVVQAVESFDASAAQRTVVYGAGPRTD